MWSLHQCNSKACLPSRKAARRRMDHGLGPTCLSGIALTWHVMLPSQIAWHWGSLQQALVERFVLVSEGAAEGSTPSLMPTKTIQPRIFPRTSGLRAFVTESARFGLIQVHAVGLTVSTYLSSFSSSPGRLYLTQHINEALRIRFVPSVHPHSIQVVKPGSATAPTLDHLGVTRFVNDSSSNICADERFYLTYTDRSQKSTSWNSTSGPTKAAIWTISDKNVIQASWDCIDLIPFVGIAKPREGYHYDSENEKQAAHPIITMAVDEAGFFARFQGDNPKYVKAVSQH
ncbi:hypothetical protein FRB93_002064 [Tulasnella sp. JGI-2019a]|nr:hypothetical protein FRB93_002064 [Tulasnella sp. JGI-2019a]